jgi:hypothetical protein
MLLLGGAAPASAGRGLIVGVNDDTVKWLARQNGVLGVQRDLGLDAVRLTVHWKHGQTKPTPLQQTFLHRIALVAAARQRVVLSVYARAPGAVTNEDQRAYCAFVARAVARIPLIRDVVIWNEANNPMFWRAVRDAARDVFRPAACPRSSDQRDRLDRAATRSGSLSSGDRRRVP